MSRWLLQFDGPPIAVTLVLTFVLLYLIWRHYPMPPASISPLRRVALILLRTLAILAILFLLARPVLAGRTVRLERPSLAVLIDHSRSLGTRDVAMSGARTPQRRVEILAQAFAREASLRRRLTEHYDTSFWSFSASVEPLGDWQAAADGAATGIADAIDTIASIPGGPPSAFLVISDGAENLVPPQRLVESAERIAAAHVPIVTVGVGSDVPVGDAGYAVIRAIRAPADATYGTSIPIAADITALGLRHSSITVELLWDNAVVATRTIRPTTQRLEQTVEFSHVADQTGFHRIDVRIAPPRGSSTADGTGSNAGNVAAPPESQVHFVQVTDDKVEVLLIESHPRYEAAFIHRALSADRRIRVTSAWLQRPAAAANLTPAQRVNPLPRSADEWQRYQVVIVGDVERSQLSGPRLNQLAAAVTDSGVGLVTLGGLREMQATRSPPLSELSPTRFDAGRPAPREVRLVPTQAGLRQFLDLQSGQPEPQPVAPTNPENAGWSQLPPTHVGARLGSPKPTAEVFATDAEGEPLIAGITAGKGRIVAVAADGTWRWSMQRDTGAELHARFWRQLVLWTAHRRLSAYIRTDRTRYERTALRSGRTRIHVEAHLADPLTGRPLDGVRPHAILKAPSQATSAPSDDGTPITLRKEGAAWVAEIRPDELGAFTIEMTARPSNSAVGTSIGDPSAHAAITASYQFAIVESDIERQTPQANLDLLRRISTATSENGGKFYSADRFADALKHLLALDRRRPVETAWREDLAARIRWPLVLLACGALSLEWLIRKRSGVI